jgi:hypothetical protein
MVFGRIAESANPDKLELFRASQALKNLDDLGSAPVPELKQQERRLRNDKGRSPMQPAQVGARISAQAF